MSSVLRVYRFITPPVLASMWWLLQARDVELQSRLKPMQVEEKVF